MVCASIQYALPLTPGEKLNTPLFNSSFCAWVVCTWLASFIFIVLSFEITPAVYDSIYLLNSCSAAFLDRYFRKTTKQAIAMRKTPAAQIIWLREKRPITEDIGDKGYFLIKILKLTCYVILDAKYFITDVYN